MMNSEIKFKNENYVDIFFGKNRTTSNEKQKYIKNINQENIDYVVNKYGLDKHNDTVSNMLVNYIVDDIINRLTGMNKKYYETFEPHELINVKINEHEFNIAIDDIYKNSVFFRNPEFHWELIFGVIEMPQNKDNHKHCFDVVKSILDIHALILSYKKIDTKSVYTLTIDEYFIEFFN